MSPRHVSGDYSIHNALSDQIDACVVLKDNWFRPCACQRDAALCSYCDGYAKARKVATLLREMCAEELELNTKDPNGRAAQLTTTQQGETKWT